MASGSSSAVRSVYRQLIRSQYRAFKGDIPMQKVAKQTISQEFKKNLGEKDEMKIKEMLIAGQEAIDFLENNVVQGQLNERGNYEFDAAKVDESKLPRDK